MKQLFILFFIFCFSATLQAADFTVGNLDYEIVSVKDKVARPISLNSSVDCLDIPYKVQYEGITFTVPEIYEITNSDIGSGSIQTVKKIILHEGIQKLNYAFRYFSALESINFPSSLHTLGETFSYCTSLTSIVIPQNITSIEGATFKNCTNLINVTFEGNPQFTYKDLRGTVHPTAGVFENCSNLEVIELPQSAKWLGRSFFAGCKNLKSVILSSDCLSIGEDCFKDCTSLSTIDLPQTLVALRYGAFYNSGISGNIVLPNNVRYIGECAFRDCSGIDSFTFPNNCALLVERMVLCGCSNLKSITIPSNGAIIEGAVTDSPIIEEIISLNNFPPQIESNFVPNSTYLKAKLKIRRGALTAYQNYDGWNNFINVETSFNELPNYNIIFNFYIPDTYVQVFDIYYPQKSIELMSGNSAKIDVSYTRAGFTDSHSDFVPYYNDVVITKSATIEDIGFSDIWGQSEYSQRYFITPPIHQGAEFAIKYESASIIDVTTDEDWNDQNTEIYSLNGVKINSAIGNLNSGIYILRNGHNIRKIIVK